MGMKFSKWSLQIERNNYCPDCLKGIMAFCAICNGSGPIDEENQHPDSVVRCKYKTCELYYHPKCLIEQ